MKTRMGWTFGMVAATLFAATHASAASISWTANGLITTATADVSTAGTLYGALEVGANANQTINGQLFTADSGGGGAISGGVADFTFASTPDFNLTFGGFYSGGSPAAYTAGLTTARYQDNGSNSGNADGTVTIGGLNLGDKYEVQVWMADDRGCCGNRDRVFTAGNSQTLNTGGTGGKPQWAIGKFTADASTQAFSISDATKGPQINLIQVRSLTATSATINWGAATTITGNSDVSTTGTLFGAYNFGSGGNTVVNGVPFVGSNGHTADGNVKFSTVETNAGNAYGSGSNPFNSLSSDYQKLLQTGLYVDGTLLTVTLSNLTPNQQYQIQYFVNDSRGGFGPGRNETLSGLSSVILDYNFAASEGGVGQYSIGTFTTGAGETSFSFTATANASSQINGLQIRLIPEPGSLSLLALGAVGLLRFARRRRN